MKRGKRVLFSIIIPVYNNERYVGRAIESVLAQEVEDYELIIIDDGSTDGTAKILDSYAALESKIKVIHQENQWIYASFNRGIREAKGEYVYILNSDDLLRRGSLKVIESIAKKYEPDVVWTKVLAHRCDENQNIVDYDIYQMDKWVKEDKFLNNVDEVRAAWPFLEESSLAHNQANLYKRSLMLNHPFRNDVYGADILFNISIAPDVQSAYIFSEIVYEHLIYNKPEMNASVGKYYEYEHVMFNEMCEGYIALFENWGISLNEYSFLAKRRVSQITHEIKMLERSFLTTEDKLKRIFGVYADEFILKCAKWLGAEEELESRILSGVRELLVRYELNEDSEMYFVYELLEALLCYEKDIDDFERMEKAVNHPLNPMHIGKIFYEKLQKVN